MDRHCDRIARRRFLKAGLFGGLGISLADLLRHEAVAGTSPAADRKSAIFIYLDGGQSHLESWDMKPDAGETAGEFRPVATNLDGLQVCELMPQLARQADKYCVLRGVEDAIAVHGRGMRLVRTGNRPRASLKYPDVGSIICKEKEQSVPRGVPPFVSLPVSVTNSAAASPGYLGVGYGAFSVNEDPSAEDFTVRALSTPAGMSLARAQKRMQLVEKIDTAYRDVDLRNDNIEGMDRFYRQAYDILRSDATRRAFDLGREADSLRDRYGRTKVGQACQLARRLVEAGVRCVTIDFGGWDTHKKNFSTLKDKLLPPWDAALAALLEDLADRGLLANTLVWSTGEMGRTPKINKDAGRDHWGKAMSMVLAGGGIAGGRVRGKTDKQGAEVVDGGCTPRDVAATVLHALGIDPRTEYHTSTGRPVMAVGGGKVLHDIFA